mmetsp:Transcript_3250/g.8004  ORF Transcript_3250/g.8004 Transcript_3250/m.8004 type:complete len:237 (+) Transcript_3250:376-1086(+)
MYSPSGAPSGLIRGVAKCIPGVHRSAALLTLAEATLASAAPADRKAGFAMARTSFAASSKPASSKSIHSTALYASTSKTFPRSSPRSSPMSKNVPAMFSPSRPLKTFEAKSRSKGSGPAASNLTAATEAHESSPTLLSPGEASRPDASTIFGSAAAPAASTTASADTASAPSAEEDCARTSTPRTRSESYTILLTRVEFLKATLKSSSRTAFHLRKMSLGGRLGQRTSKSGWWART